MRPAGGFVHAYRCDKRPRKVIGLCCGGELVPFACEREIILCKVRVDLGCLGIKVCGGLRIDV